MLQLILNKDFKTRRSWFWPSNIVWSTLLLVETLSTAHWLIWLFVCFRMCVRMVPICGDWNTLTSQLTVTYVLTCWLEWEGRAWVAHVSTMTGLNGVAEISRCFFREGVNKLRKQKRLLTIWPTSLLKFDFHNIPLLLLLLYHL